MGVRKETEEERDGKKRVGWRERMESKKKKNTNRINFQVSKLYYLWGKGIMCYFLMYIFPFMHCGCTGTYVGGKKRSV